MDFWGVAPLLGRGFDEQDVQSGAPPVVLLNYRFWKREFNSDKKVVGTTIMLNGKMRTIIGVMPPRFQAVGSDVYLPVSWTRPEPTRGRYERDVDDPLYFWATGIVKRDVNFDTAAADIHAIAVQLAKVRPEEYPKNFRVNMKWLNDVVLGNFKQTLLLLFGAVGLLLFISCSNVAGLLLAHASARTKEISLRCRAGSQPVAADPATAFRESSAGDCRISGGLRHRLRRAESCHVFELRAYALGGRDCFESSRAGVRGWHFAVVGSAVRRGARISCGARGLAKGTGQHRRER